MSNKNIVKDVASFDEGILIRGYDAIHVRL